MYKLEIECYGGKVTVETDFINFASAVGELINKLQQQDVYGVPQEGIVGISAVATPVAPKKRGRPVGSKKKL
jgi:hypothetical protein